jgi:two-component system, NarL family, response regulator LiaR
VHDALNPLTELTDRGLDVVRLIADGLRNTDIALRLVLSEKTVKGQVSNTLYKLHVADRTQVAILRGA